MTRNGRSRQCAFWPSELPDRAEIKIASGNEIEYHGKSTRAPTNVQFLKTQFSTGAGGEPSTWSPPGTS
eukprot:3571768-Pyramimonas_sp.AAC.1